MEAKKIKEHEHEHTHDHDSKSESCCGDCQGGESCTKIKSALNSEIFKEIATI